MMKEETEILLRERFSKITDEFASFIDDNICCNVFPYCEICYKIFVIHIATLLDDVEKVRTKEFKNNVFSCYETIVSAWENDCKQYGKDASKKRFHETIRKVILELLHKLNESSSEEDDMDAKYDEICTDVKMQLLNCGCYIPCNWFWHAMYLGQP